MSSTRSARPGCPRILVGITVLAIAVVVTLMQRGGPSSDGPSQPPSGSVPQAQSTPTVRPQPSARDTRTDPSSVRSSSSGLPGSEFTIGFWNIEWLGKPEDRSGLGQGVAQSPDDLAEVIMQSQSSVVGLAEVVSKLPGRPIRSREVEAIIDALRTRTGDQWAYTLNPGRADGDQLTGVMWNTRVVTAIDSSDQAVQIGSVEAWPLPVPRRRSSQGSALWNRPPHAMKFSTGPGRTDFVLIVVHMKADYNGDFAAHRKEEAEALVASLDDVRTRFKDLDIVVIGDTNCVSPQEPAAGVLAAAGYRDLNPGREQTHWRGGSMDRAFVLADRPVFKAVEFDVVSEPKLDARRLEPRDFKRRLSDHYMVTMTFRSMPDDD